MSFTPPNDAVEVTSAFVPPSDSEEVFSPPLDAIEEPSKFDKIKTSLYDLAEQIPTPMPAVGAEVVANMATSIPYGVTSGIGKLISTLKGDIAEEQLEAAGEQYTPQFVKDMIYEPKLSKSKEALDVFGKVYKGGTQALAIPGAYIKADLSSDGTDADWNKKFIESYKQVSPLTSALMDIGGVAQMGRDIHLANKQGKANAKPQVEPTPEITSYNELFAQEGLKLVDTRINNIQAKVDKLVEDGLDVQRDTPILEALDAELKQRQAQKADFEGILRGETKQEAIDRMYRTIEKMEEMKRKKAYNTSEETPLTPEEIAENEAIKEAGIRKAQDEAPQIPEYQTDPYSYVKQVAEETQPKTSPQQVALEKIGEAMNITKGELESKIQTTKEKLGSIPDTPENSSLRTSLNEELKAFESIQKGEQPDLSWFEGKKQEVPVVEPVVTQVSDILNKENFNFQDIVDNRDKFFDRDGKSNVFFDKNFQGSDFSKKSITVVKTILDKIGMSKDNVYITLEDSLGTKAGSTGWFGDNTVIRLSKGKIEALTKAFDDLPEYFKGIREADKAQAKLIYATTRVMAHEVGHTFLLKLLREFGESTQITKLLKEFNSTVNKDYIENVSPVDFYKGDLSATRFRENQAYFSEFIAERVTKHLLEDKDLLAGFRKDRSKSLRQVFDAGYQMLKKLSGKIGISKDTYFDTEIKFFLEANKELVASTGRTIWEVGKLGRNEGSFPKGDLSDLTLEEIKKVTDKQGFNKVKVLTSDQAEQLFLGLDANDSPTVSERIFRDLGKGAITTVKEFFGRNNVVDMNPKDQLVRNFYTECRKIDIEIEGITNDLWYDQTVPKDVKFWQVLSKVKDAASPYMVLLKSSKQDMFVLHNLFRKGFEEGLDYADNLSKNGTHLTPDQVKYYNTFSKLFKKMYDYSVQTQETLGKKWILDERKGWYPAVRSGQYTVQVNYGDLTVRAQSFSTKLQAQKFREKLLKDSKTNRFDISDIIDKTEEPRVFTNREAVDSIVEKFSRLVPQHKDYFSGEGRRVLDAMATRGGKLGFHHEFRENLAGYKGNELFLTPESLGDSFKSAIESAISEKGMQLKEMKYKTKFTSILEDQQLKDTKPNSVAAMQTMFDSALGRHDTVMGKGGDIVSHAVDKIADSVLQWFGKEKTSDVSLIRMTTDNVVETFAMLKMMPKATFSIIGQLIGNPAMTIAKMSYDTPLKAYSTYAKGVLKLTTGDAELWSVIKEVSQRTNTFEAQFVEAISKRISQNKTAKLLKDTVLLQAPGKGAESLSRIMAFSVFYEHYKSLGVSRNEAINSAIIKTGDSLHLYDSANAAPIFKHLGPVGEAIKPLMGFGQNQLGNILGMGMYAGKNPKTWAPLVNFTLVTIAMSGVLGLPFIADYEKFRAFLAEKGNYDLPSILDVVASRNDSIDEFISPETRLLGVPSLTGYDLSSSTRASASLPTLMAGVFLGNGHPLDVMPVTDWALSVPGAVATIAKGIAGSPAQAADMAKAVDVVSPSGHLGYGIKEAMNLNTTRISGEPTNQRMIGKTGDAGGTRTQQDIIAGLLGTKTTEARMDELVNFNETMKEDYRKKKIEKNMMLLAETGEEQYLNTLAEMGVTKKQIEQRLETLYENKKIPLTIRRLMDKNKERQQRTVQGLFNFGRLD